MKSRIQSYIDATTEYLVRQREVCDMSLRICKDADEDEFSLEGHKFSVVEAEFSDVIRFTKMRMVSVKSIDFPDMEAISVAYKIDFWGGKDYPELRVKACMRLAHSLVTDMLPKIDMNIKIQLHNEEVERLLEEI